MRPTSFLLLALTACGGLEPAEPASHDAQDAFSVAMRQRLELADKARDAVIGGSFVSARIAGAELAALPAPVVPEPWLPYLDLLDRSAYDLASASDLDAAGQAVARIGSACGICHEFAGGGPQADLERAVDEHRSAPTHMHGHLLAADHMWLGLIGPAPELYEGAAQVLALGAVEARATRGVELSEEAQVLEQQVHEVADAAARTSDPGERGTLYGHMLSSCAGCHRALDVAPELAR